MAGRDAASSWHLTNHDSLLPPPTVWFFLTAVTKLGLSSSVPDLMSKPSLETARGSPSEGYRVTDSPSHKEYGGSSHQPQFKNKNLLTSLIFLNLKNPSTFIETCYKPATKMIILIYLLFFILTVTQTFVSVWSFLVEWSDVRHPISLLLDQSSFDFVTRSFELIFFPVLFLAVHTLFKSYPSDQYQKGKLGHFRSQSLLTFLLVFPRVHISPHLVYYQFSSCVTFKEMWEMGCWHPALHSYNTRFHSPTFFWPTWIKNTSPFP